MNNYSQMDLTSYLAKYIDENGCSFREACEELGIDEAEFSSEKNEDEMY